MAEKLLRRGQRVYAADGTYVGRLVQCDARFMVIRRTPWKPDHWIVPNQEVGAGSREAVVLRSLPEALRAETEEPWLTRPDPLGNANGVDLEPLRAGMAELDDELVGTRRVVAARSPLPARAEPEHVAPLPSPEDARGLERRRVEQLEARVERALAVEIEDVEIDAAAAPPPGYEPVARYELELPTGAGSPRVPAAVPAPVAREANPRAPAPTGPGRPEPSATARRARGGRASLEGVLREAGFTSHEAEAIAAGGFDRLAALVGGPR